MSDCERCRNYEICEMENKGTIDRCFFVYPRAYEIGISDMEKLQKIESLYGIDKFGKVLTREERDREVQKILRG